MSVKSLFDKFKQGLARTARLFDVRSWFGRKVDQDFLNELEAKLIQADVGVASTRTVIENVRKAFLDRTAGEDLVSFVKAELKSQLVSDSSGVIKFQPSGPTVVLIAGVNGSGKTTSIAKLSHWLKEQNKSVLLAACDTFRAAAADQLSIWAERAKVEIVKGLPNSDPASVAHDACERALARKVSVLIVDTAGRLHTQTHLMRELEKIRGVLARKIPAHPTKCSSCLTQQTARTPFARRRSSQNRSAVQA